MKLDEVRHIKQTSEDSVVNEYLSKGYKLIKIFSSKIVIDNQDLVQPIYILGRDKVNLGELFK